LGISAYGDEILETVEVRELRVWREDLWEMAAEDLADLVFEVRPGIFSSFVDYDDGFLLPVFQRRL
jgi:hypothetical protein